MTRKVCEMVFGTSQGGTRVIRVPDPRDNINISHVETAVGRFVAANPFHPEVGALINIQSVDLVRTTRVPLISA